MMDAFRMKFGREPLGDSLYRYPYFTMTPDEFISAMKKSVETGVAYDQEDYDEYLDLIASGAAVD